jgi:N-carbamoyl-L-amino-acid hydrolase
MAAPGENLTIDGTRLWDSLMEMAKIGPGVRGGNNRQTVTDDDAKGRALFQKWCDAGAHHGCRRDGHHVHAPRGRRPRPAAGLCRLASRHPADRRQIRRRAGRAGGLEIVRTLNDLGIKTRHPIVVTNWTNEEGTRFAPAMLASGVFAGVLDQDWAYDRTDADGKRFGDELERIGWKGEEPVGERKMQAFFELHIEQGPILEAEGKDIGVVTHGQGLRWIQCTVTGKESHTGSTPMPMRKNAGRGLAQITELVHTRSRWTMHPERGRRHRPYRHLPQQPQHHPRQGGVHHRFPQP